MDRGKTGGTGVALAAGGRWLDSDAAVLDRRLAAASLGRGGSARRDGCGSIAAKIEALDTVGAWLVLRLKALASRKDAEASIENLAASFMPLLAQAEKYVPAAVPVAPPQSEVLNALAFIGAATIEFLRQAEEVLGFFGLVVMTWLTAWRHPGRIRFIAFVSHVQRTGAAALPIVGLLSFLIGIVFAYQGADQLRYYGAEIFTVNLLGLSFLRELGVLLTAIIVAGRSGSAFTAEIGTMQVNEEIDAMTTLGLDPIEVLVLPRLAALIVTLPLLTFYANIMGLAGGAFICATALDIPLPLFLQQLQGAITGWSFRLGILKAPFFAVCIAIVGCRRGCASRAAPKASAVSPPCPSSNSIFLVIIFDAAFSILFAQLHI